MSGHLVPAGIAALLARLRAHPKLVAEKVQIDHGPPRELRSVPDAIGIGVAAQDATVGQGSTTHRLGSREEQFDVTCAIDSAVGDADDDALARCEVRVYELLDVLLEILENDRTLGGAVMTATLARHTYRARREQHDTGAYLEATVRLQGFRPRR